MSLSPVRSAAGSSGSSSVGYSSTRRLRQPEMWVLTMTRRTYVSSADWSVMLSQD